ncbi:Uu.00g104720.m01.CDS01 [Anthostomella pinea]|uniref:Uu.00g104720.m01.CDS01 n=1 Tax=Anthostomella pinea TaxID=933095 RepID=A0AAI8VDV4_9PEZI|nr:Uu.00g104720.m01.CDS01 [Anthostomella pinea]
MVNSVRARLASLADLLSVGHGFAATDPRDHLFAVLGMVQDTELSDDIKVLIKPDYAKTIADVLRDAVRYAIVETPQALERILGGVSHRFDADLGNEFCSWAPRFDRPFDCELDPPPLTFLRHFSASDGAKLDVSSLAVYSSIQPNVLSLFGLVVDIVIKVGDVFDARRWSIDSAQDGSLERTIRAAKSILCSVKGLADSDTLIRTLLRNYGTSGQTSKDGESTDDFQDAVNGLELSGTLNKTQIDLLWNNCRNLCFFTTASGLCGLAPRLTQEGDIVVVLFGTDVPFSLRPIKADYRLIGATYVHGIINGEAVREHRELGKPDRLFHIR